MSDKTIEALRAALLVSPENLPLRRHLAATLAECGQFSDAQSEYQAILRLEPGDAMTLLELGRVLLKLERPEEAAARLSESIAHFSRAQQENEAAQAHMEMARALLQLRRRDKARQHYNHALHFDPTLSDKSLENELFAAKEYQGVEDQARRIPDGPAIGSLHDSDFSQDDAAQSAHLISGTGIEMERPNVTFADVGGMEELKEQIRLDIIYPFQHPEIYEAYGKKVGGGILLYGPPGCGKTYVARATAGEVQAHFVVVGIEDVFNMWMGESERRIHAIFDSARRSAPAILFFDELEALAGKRSNMEHSPHYSAIVNQFLSEMDGAKGDNRHLLIIGATNSPWQVDAAFRRPGRFDKIIFVPPPDRIARMEILKLHCRNKPVENLDYASLAAQMKRFSGADISAVCEAAAEIALRETLRTGKMRPLRNADFLQALKGISPTTEEWLATAKNYVMYSNQTGLYDPIARYLQNAAD